MHTGRRTVFFYLDVAIRNSLRSSNFINRPSVLFWGGDVALVHKYLHIRILGAGSYQVHTSWYEVDFFHCRIKTKRYSTTLWLFYLPDFYFANQRSRQCNSSTYGQNNIRSTRMYSKYGTYRSRVRYPVYVIRTRYILYGIVLVYSARHVLSYILAEQ